jgi:hypothetical protein
MNEESNIEILQHLLDSVRVRGYEETNEMLKVDKPKEKLPHLNEYDKYVVAQVSKAFKLEPEDLFFGRYRRGAHKYALGLCVHLLYETRTLGEIQKKIFTTKNKSLLSKYRNDVLELNQKIYPQYHAKIQALIKKIKKYKTSNR